MKVLHVTDKMNPEKGGVCQAIRTIIRGLSKLGIHNEVVCLDSSSEAFIFTDPFITHALGPVENLWSYSKKLMPWLLQNMDQFSIVIVHGLWQYPGHAVVKARNKLLVDITKKNEHLHKLFVMPHGMLDPYFQKAPDRKLKAIRNVIYWKLIERHLVNTADGLLFTCAEEKELARLPFRPYEPKSQLVVSLGVDPPPPYQVQMKRSFLDYCPEVSQSPYFLFLSRIHPKKGVDLLLESYAKLLKKCKEGPEIDKIPKLVIAGPGIESDYGNTIAQMVAKDSFLKNRVLFPGMLTGGMKWGAFYGCEAFVLMSHQENFGIAIVEALACEKAVLISNKINIWREIESNGGGLVEDDTILGSYALLESWMKLSVDKKRLMEKNAKKVYSRFYSVANAAKNLSMAINSKQYERYDG